MSKHTPGPWNAVTNGSRTYAHIMANNSIVPVAIVPLSAADGYGREEGEANARLISAAPDLLAALQMLDQYGHTQATWQRALDAIAKAKGETA